MTNEPSWRHQLNGDPDPTTPGGDTEVIQETLEMARNSVPHSYSLQMDILESNEIGKKKEIRDRLNGMVLLVIAYLCRNYKLGHLDPDQVEKFETIMFDFSFLLDRLQNNKIKIPPVVIEQLECMKKKWNITD